MVEDYVSRASICISAHDRLDRRQNKHKNAASMFDQLEGRNYVHDCARILLETVSNRGFSGYKDCLRLTLSTG